MSNLRNSIRWVQAVAGAPSRVRLGLWGDRDQKVGVEVDLDDFRVLVVDGIPFYEDSRQLGLGLVGEGAGGQ